MYGVWKTFYYRHFKEKLFDIFHVRQWYLFKLGESKSLI